MWFDNETENYFITVFADDTFSVDTESKLSDRVDMADTGTMDEVVGIYKIKGGKFYEVRPDHDTNRKINTDEEYPLRYAQTDLVIERLGNLEVVGTVTLTDH